MAQLCHEIILQHLFSSQNGYQSQKRSLVEDAKFETRVHNESKKSWLQAVRQQSEGKFGGLTDK